MTRKEVVAIAATITALVLASVQPVIADGIIIPEPPWPELPPLVDSWLTIRYHRVTVSIDDQVAIEMDGWGLGTKELPGIPNGVGIRLD